MPKINIKSLLKTFGISKLKPKQKEIINLILKKKILWEFCQRVMVKVYVICYHF